jgi:tetratricopeptide (TPR) repeat protein
MMIRRIAISCFLFLVLTGCGPAFPVRDLLEKGNALYGDGRYDEAVSCYTRIIETLRDPGDPNLASAHYNRGLAFLEKGSFGEAVADFSAVIDGEEGDEGACRQRAQAYESLGDYERALADYTRAIAREPGDADLYLWRGNVHRKWNRRHDLAAKDFAMAVRLRPTDRRALYALGMACFMTADYDGAIESLSRVIGIHPGDGRYYNGRGQSYLQKGNREKALCDLRKACELREESSCILLKFLAAKERTGGRQPGKQEKEEEP